jgi:Tubulin/FtsZ family, GTPase domain
MRPQAVVLLRPMLLLLFVMAIGGGKLSFVRKFDVVNGFTIPKRTKPILPMIRKLTHRHRTHMALLRSSAAENEDDFEEDDMYSDGMDIDAASTSTTLNSHSYIDHVPCKIQVIGVGGGGGNAVNHMIQQQDDRLQGVTFYAINTDAQALSQSNVPNVVNIGKSLTRGLGAGGNPIIGKEAALENALELKKMMQGSDLVFITAGMGGGTGSGAAPVVAEIAKKECGCLTVGIVTKPFAFEGRRRMKQAEEAIEQLRLRVDTLIVVSNDKLLQLVEDDTPMVDAFVTVDDILRQGVIVCFVFSEFIHKTLNTGTVAQSFANPLHAYVYRGYQK